MLQALRLAPLFLALLFATSCGDEAEEGRDPEAVIELLSGGDASRGQAFFNTSCANGECHGTDGDFGPAPDLSVEVPQYDTIDLADIILNGKGQMPAQESLQEQAVADIILYLRQAFPDPVG